MASFQTRLTRITICFLAGTLIRTPDGEVAVESLKHGDLVLTQDGRTVPVDWLGIQTVSLRFADKMRVLPIRIRAGALAANVPCRDLLVSPDHAILVDGTLIHAGALVNGTSIVRETNVSSTLKYYHVEVEDHSLIMAENTPAETFVDNVDRLNFDDGLSMKRSIPTASRLMNCRIRARSRTVRSRSTPRSCSPLARRPSALMWPARLSLDLVNLKES